jgi:hypothetical protein
VNYFACQYYTARGLLLDSHVYSCGKEQRKAEDRKKVRVGGSGDGPFVADGEDCGNAQREDLHESQSTECEGVATSSKGPPDMYKALDGSALVAIGGLIFAKVHTLEPESRPPGMLLQELVSTLLKPNVPPGWEKEMEAAGVVPSDESIGPEIERAEETQSDESGTSSAFDDKD